MWHINLAKKRKRRKRRMGSNQMDGEEAGERVHPWVPPLFYLICPLPFPEELSNGMDEFAKNVPE